MSTVKEFFNALWIIAAMPLVLLGCCCGWLYGAFAEGCEMGYKDWNEV